MNHVDKDSRPDLLKGTYVKVEPGGERKTQKGSLKLAHLERGEERQMRGHLRSGVGVLNSYRASSCRSGLCQRPLTDTWLCRATTVRVTGLVIVTKARIDSESGANMAAIHKRL